MTDNPQQPPAAPGPAPGKAKPAEPGPVEPPGIATSILPERQRDAARHPEGDARPPDALGDANDVAAGEEQTAQAGPPPKGSG